MIDSGELNEAGERESYMKIVQRKVPCAIEILLTNPTFDNDAPTDSSRGRFILYLKHGANIKTDDFIRLHQ